MSVRAKFRCRSVATIDAGGFTDPSTEVKLQAVYGNGTDDASWSKATPHGHLDMTITVPEAASAFVAGGEYWLDISPLALAPASSIVINPPPPSDPQPQPNAGTVQPIDTEAPAGDPAAPPAPAVDPSPVPAAAN